MKRMFLTGAALAAMTLYGAQAQAATAKRTSFGKLPDGTAVEAVTLTGRNGVSARIMTLGATLQAFNAPDRSGKVADVTLGYDDAASYITAPNYWGQTIGRYANRIAGGKFTLDGKAYQLTQNDKANSLHGGTVGVGTVLYAVAIGPIVHRMLPLFTIPDRGQPLISIATEQCCPQPR